MGQTNPRRIRLDRCNQVDIKNAGYQFTGVFFTVAWGLRPSVPHNGHF